MKYYPKKKSNVQFNEIIKHNNTSWKSQNIIEIQKNFEDRFQDIKKEINKLYEDFYWNKLIYESEIRFEPIIGKKYYLYEEDNKRFLSLISPFEWKKNYIGTFILKNNKKWEICKL